MKEIGSFLELCFEKGKEYYTESKYGDKNVVRLNSGRNAILYAVHHYGVNKVYMPRYQCGSVIECLKRAGIEIKFYTVDEDFVPQIRGYDNLNTAFVVVNYYGIFSTDYIKHLTSGYKNVIVDNAQAFYAEPIDEMLNCYSARKWVGVPDGAYVIGDGASVGMERLEQDFSSDTASFLLQRIEYGCEGKAYESRTKNEHRLDGAPIKSMSSLTRTILDGTDYKDSRQKRVENFNICRRLFDSINEIHVEEFVDDGTVPYVYPLLLEKNGIIEAMHKNKIFQGHWWEYLVDITPENTFEHRLSKYIVPITIDYRYDEQDMIRQYHIIRETMEADNG